MDKFTVFVAALAMLTVFIVGNGLVTIVNTGYTWDRQFGDLFELADRASDACTKEKYLVQFNERLVAEGLNQGQSAAWWPRPTSDLAQNFNASKSLEFRLHALCSLDPKSAEYQFGMQQVTLQEFCWFPIEIFRQGFMLRHGIWGVYLPIDVTNRCSSGGSRQ